MGPFADARVLAVIRYRRAADLLDIVSLLRDADVAAVEVTAETPGALDAVRGAAAAGSPIGVGTIRSAEEVSRFADAGAAFLVSPSVDPMVSEAAAARGISFLPGVLTPTEVALAIAHGATTVKLFPAMPGGPGYLRALRGPFDDVAFVPTGGIEIDAIPSWLKAGAACVGLGSALVGAQPPATPAERSAVRERAATAVRLAVGSP